MLKNLGHALKAWAMAVWGPVALNRQERVLRVLEEATELAQAEGITPQQFAKIGERVFSRPADTPEKEYGGLLITVLAYSSAADIDPDVALDTELRRFHDPARLDKFRAGHIAKIAQGVTSSNSVYCKDCGLSSEGNWCRSIACAGKNLVAL